MSFVKAFFASCLGTIVGIGGLFGLILLYATVFSGGGPYTKPNSVLKLTLQGDIPELSNNHAQGGGDFQAMFDETVGLVDMMRLIDLAKEDDHIKGIYLEFGEGGTTAGLSTLKSLRNKLEEFKQAGKFIISHSTSYSQKEYYLASVANHVYLHPLGGMDFRGFSAQLMFYKGLMDKMGVTAQIYYAGKFKSATEPFRRTDMSPENRLQVREFIGGAYQLYLETISRSRSLSPQELYRYANEALIQNADDALKYKLVDGLKYKDEVIDEMRSNTGTTGKDQLEVVTLSKYYEIKKNKLVEFKAKDRIAVVFAEGSIVDGNGENGSIGGDRYARIIREIRQDDKVKAIVLRVNSGGGSAMASDIIWRELELAKAQGIKVVASMGDVAASGGYYISANADCIYAEDNTITGSIGVFGMIPNMRGLYQDKLGLTMDTVKTAKFSAMDGSFYGFTDEEGALIQKSVDEIYMTFKKRVSEGRGMDIALVDSFAQGRVWLGNKAQQIGLVDSLGGLEAAIAEAAKLANLPEYRLVRYPEVKTFSEKILAGFSGEEQEEGVDIQLKANISNELKQEFGELYELYEAVKTINESKGVQMRMPFVLNIE